MRFTDGLRYIYNADQEAFSKGAKWSDWADVADDWIDHKAKEHTMNAKIETILKRLEDAGFYCRTYDKGSEELANALEVVWRHMTKLDGSHLDRWRDAFVSELIDRAMGWGGNRTFGEPELRYSDIQAEVARTSKTMQDEPGSIFRSYRCVCDRYDRNGDEYALPEFLAMCREVFGEEPVLELRHGGYWEGDELILEPVPRPISLDNL